MLKLNVLASTPDCLDSLEIATPCDVPWESLIGDDRVRHCGHCRQDVYNVQAMSRSEALRMIGMPEGRLCLRLFRRNDGTVVTADCWSRLRAARQKGVLAFVAMLVVVGWAEISAILVGLHGLRRLVGEPTARVAQETPPQTGFAKPRVVQPPPSTTGHFLMGGAPSPVTERPRPAKKKRLHHEEQSTYTVTLGRMKVR